MKSQEMLDIPDKSQTKTSLLMAVVPPPQLS